MYIYIYVHPLWYRLYMFVNGETTRLLLIENFTTDHLMLSRGSVSIELEFRHTLHADVEKLILNV